MAGRDRSGPPRRGRTGRPTPDHAPAPPRPGPRPPARPEPPRSRDTALIWGWHPVAEALRSPRRKLLRLSATQDAAERIGALATPRGLPVETVSPEAIASRVPRDAVHQGLLLETLRLEPIEIDDLPDRGIVLVLDQVTDPHNVGAILRTAAAFGVAGLVLTDRHAPDLSGTLAKAASGGLEHVPVALVINLARALDQLGDHGYVRIGLDSDGPASLASALAPGHAALALVLGAEGKGLRRLTRERCDLIARLDLPGPIKSLNVSNACAAALTLAGLASR